MDLYAGLALFAGLLTFAVGVAYVRDQAENISQGRGGSATELPNERSEGGAAFPG